MSFRILTNFLLAFCLMSSTVRADISFDGSNDIQQTTAILSDFMSASTGSIGVWVNSTGTPTVASSACYDSATIIADAGNFLGIYRHTTSAPLDEFCGYNWDGSEDKVTSTFASGWHHLVWVHTGGNILFYIDGLSAGSTASGNTSDISGILKVGYSGTTNPHLTARIAEIRIFPTALSATDVGAIGKSALHGLAPYASSGSWDFQACSDGADCTSVVFPDYSGHARTFTNANATQGGTGKASDYLSYPWGVE